MSEPAERPYSPQAVTVRVFQASASMLCRHIEGKSLQRLNKFAAPSMLKLIGVPLTPNRQQCGLLAFKALKTLAYSSD